MTLLQDKEQLLAPLLDLLAEQEMDLELEFEDMELEWGGMQAKLSGKTLLAAKNKEEVEE